VGGLRLPALGVEKTGWPIRSLDEIDELQADHSALATILQARRAVSIEGMSFSARALWTIYLTILEDALKTLDTLIQFLKAR
jgi:hypothetical protein